MADGVGDHEVELLKLDGGPTDERALRTMSLAELPGDAHGWDGTGAIPYPADADPAMCWEWFKNTPLLRPNIDALAVNKHGFGYQLAPEIDLQARDADEQVRVSIVLEKLAAAELPSVTLEEVRARRAQIEVESPIERAQLEVKLRAFGGDVPFLGLCLRTTVRMEVAGNAYWEVLRDDDRSPARGVLLPETTVRATRLDQKRTEVERWERSSPVSFRLRREHVRLRRYVQLQDGTERVWFKQFGDPRVVSAATGRVYASVAEMREAEKDADQATEILHFKADLLDNPVSVYGAPRWLGAIRGIAGTRSSEEANERYLSNDAVPEGFIAVNGTAAPDMAEKVKNYLKERRASGKQWEPLVLVAKGGGGAVDAMAQGSVPSITWIPLRAMKDDAMFQDYESRCARKVQQQFRLPDIMVGRSEESNKAQAEAARDMAEEQVFAVERAAFDAVVNRLLEAMGARYWKYVSNGPKTTDPPVVVEMIARLCTAGIITPHEGRELAMAALGQPLDRSWAPWKGIPLEYAKLGYAPPSDPTLVLSEDEVEARRRRPFVPLSESLLKQGLTVDLFREACGYPPHEDAEKGKMLLAEVAPEKPAPAAPGGGGAFGGKPPPEPEKEGDEMEKAVRGVLNARAAVLAVREQVDSELLEKARAARKTAVVEEVPEETWATWMRPGG